MTAPLKSPAGDAEKRLLEARAASERADAEHQKLSQEATRLERKHQYALEVASRFERERSIALAIEDRLEREYLIAMIEADRPNRDVDARLRLSLAETERMIGAPAVHAAVLGRRLPLPRDGFSRGALALHLLAGARYAVADYPHKISPTPKWAGGLDDDLSSRTADEIGRFLIKAGCGLEFERARELSFTWTEDVDSLDQEPWLGGLMSRLVGDEGDEFRLRFDAIVEVASDEVRKIHPGALESPGAAERWLSEKLDRLLVELPKQLLSA